MPGPTSVQHRAKTRLEEPPTEAERLRAETEKLEVEAAKRMAGARQFDDNAMRAGTEAAGAPDSPQEAIMSCGRNHSQSGVGLRSHGWFGAKVFVLIVATMVAGYVTAKLL